MNKEQCYCGSYKSFENCCQIYISGIQKAPTALKLMRSRYSAYVVHDAEYLWETTHILERKSYSKTEILNWAISNQWQKLEIIYSSEFIVEFKAYFLNDKLQNQVHQERSIFKFENGGWFYVNGTFFD